MPHFGEIKIFNYFPKNSHGKKGRGPPGFSPRVGTLTLLQTLMEHYRRHSCSKTFLNNFSQMVIIFSVNDLTTGGCLT